MYVVNATIQHKRKDGVITSQVPTFYLDETVQGILNEGHAKFIASEIINPLRIKNMKIDLTVTLV